MRISDYFKYSYLIYKNDKKRSVICIIVSVILSFLVLCSLYIGFTYNHTMNDVENAYLKEKPLVLFVIGNNEEVIKYGKKYKASNIICESSIATYIQFDNDNIILTSGRMPNTFYELLLDSQNEYNIGDKFIENDIEYLVCGLYQSNIYSDFVGDINYVTNDLDIRGVSITYSESNKGKINDINNLINVLKNNDYDFDQVEYDRLITYHRYSFIVVMVSLIIAVILFLSAIGFFSNSFIMSLNQSNKLLTMLNLCGLEKKKIIIIDAFYGIIVAGIGIIMAYLLVIVLSLVVSLDSIYYILLPANFRIILTSYKYKISYPWYIIFIILFLFIISIIITSIKNNKKLINKEISIIKE